MRRWSKLESALYRITDPAVRFQIQCRVVRMDSSYGRTNLPRYWITLGKETIWSYPGQFVVPGGATRRVDSAKLTYYPYMTDVPAISDLIREYIDTPVAELLTKQFTNDHWGLVNILRAADRRIGQRQLPLLRRKIHNAAALKVLDARQPAAVARRRLRKVSAAEQTALEFSSPSGKAGGEVRSESSFQRSCLHQAARSADRREE